MKSSLDTIIERSKKRLCSTYFRIVQSEDGFKIFQYFGAIKSSSEMMSEGWNNHVYLTKYITSDYPVFSIDDFISEDGITIRKKNDEEVLREELLEYVQYFEMDKCLIQHVKDIKALMASLSIAFEQYSTFDELSQKIVNSINSLNLPALDKANILSKYIDIRCGILKSLEEIGIEHPHSFMNDKFKFLFMII